MQPRQKGSSSASVLNWGVFHHYCLGSDGNRGVICVKNKKKNCKNDISLLFSGLPTIFTTWTTSEQCWRSRSRSTTTDRSRTTLYLWTTIYRASRSCTHETNQFFTKISFQQDGTNPAIQNAPWILPCRRTTTNLANTRPPHQKTQRCNIWTKPSRTLIARFTA